MRLTSALLAGAILEGCGLIRLHATAETTVTYPTTSIYRTTYSIVVPTTTASYYNAKATTVNDSPAVALLSAYQDAYMQESAGTSESIPAQQVIAAIDVTVPTGQSATGCTLTFQVGGTTVISGTFTPSSGTIHLTSASFSASGKPSITVLEVCSSRAMTMLVYNMVLLADPEVVTLSPTLSTTTSSSSSVFSSTEVSTTETTESSTTSTESSFTPTSTSSSTTSPSGIGTGTTEETTSTSTPPTVVTTTTTPDVTSPPVTTPTSSPVTTPGSITTVPPTTNYDSTTSIDFASATLTSASITVIDGTTAVVLTPGPTDSAEISFWIPFSNDTAGDTAALSIYLTPASPPVKAKRAPTACELTITMNGTTVYEAPVLYDTRPSTVVTNSVTLGGGITLTIQETCSDTTIPLTVSHLMLLVTVSNVVPSSSPGTDTGTETGTGTGSKSTTSGGTLSSSTPISPGSSSSGSPGSSQSSLGPGQSNSTTSTLSATGTGPGTGPVSPTSTGSGTGTLQTGTSTSAPPSSTSTASGYGFPSPIGPFAFFGCVGSIDNYPTFSLVASSSEMTIETCTSACTGSLYSGVYDMDCYCGDEIDFVDTALVARDLCSIHCPGDQSEFCGGLRDVLPLRRQVAIPNNIYLTVYVYTGSLSGSGAISTTTAVLTANVTKTFLVTSTHTILGSVTVDVFTSTVVYCPLCARPTGPVCVNGYCAGTYIFEVVTWSAMLQGTVFVRESCSCPGGWAYKPAICQDASCGGKTLYKPVPCTSSGGTSQPVYSPQSCATCAGGVVFTQAVTPGRSGTTATAPPNGHGTGSGSGSGSGSESGSGTESRSGTRFGSGPGSGSESETSSAGSAASSAGSAPSAVSTSSTSTIPSTTSQGAGSSGVVEAGASHLNLSFSAVAVIFPILVAIFFS